MNEYDQSYNSDEIELATGTPKNDVTSLLATQFVMNGVADQTRINTYFN